MLLQVTLEAQPLGELKFVRVLYAFLALCEGVGPSCYIHFQLLAGVIRRVFLGRETSPFEEIPVVKCIFCRSYTPEN